MSPVETDKECFRKLCTNVDFPQCGSPPTAARNRLHETVFLTRMSLKSLTDSVRVPKEIRPYQLNNVYL